ncbi:MAG: hypothetical protein CVT94_06960 [Bacteroidetes bacterium HGW-Bacteroidetes-11]|jgi:hypothetical protein|nr:MAG: hypothetical protein CVT94_06960 [Bacteroidetes bacterium HGW-Bacteroidetes-11]
MQLDYIDEINEYGDNIVRLYDFDSAEAEKFMKIVHETLVLNKKSLDLSSIKFIVARNCRLTLRIADEDEGISTSDKMQFYCDLTIAGYKQMIGLLEQFCNKETKGYQFLYDIDSQTDFLFSPAGTW